MVFYVRTREGFDQLLKMLGRKPSPIWADRDVFSDHEIAEMREEGVNITQFTGETIEDPDIEVIRLHHPLEIVWVQS